MGVHRFFYWLVQTYPETLIHLRGTYQACEPSPVSIDWLSLDLNAIYHPVAQALHPTPVQRGPTLLPSRPRVQPKPRIVPEITIFEGICERIEQLRTILKPRLGIFLATDGVAGFSKQKQQRSRRFKSVYDKQKSEPTSWDSNQISCGTVFMERLSRHLDEWTQTQLKTNPAWQELEIIVSDYRVVGEGEHKLLAHMRRNPQYSYAVVSPDADLIFLGMGLHNPRVWIFRENLFVDQIDASFFLVDLARFRQCVLTELSLSDEPDQSRINVVIEDFIAYLFFVGNDFIPQVASLQIATGGIRRLFSIYARVLREHGFLTSRAMDDSRYLRLEGLQALLLNLAAIEPDMLIEYQRSGQARYPDHILLKHLTYPKPEPGQTHTPSPPRPILDFEAYRRDYYESKFHGLSVKRIVHEYLRGMLFVLRYYLEGIPSKDWAYPFHYAPFFADMAEHVTSYDFAAGFSPSEFITPLEQLMAVLPGRSAHLLPEPLRHLLTSSDSPIIDLYPETFEQDLEGKKNAYEAIVLLPVIEVERVRLAFRSFEPSLSPEDRARNQPGEVRIYRSA